MVNMKKRILFVEPVVKENNDSRKNYLSRFKSSETIIELESLSEGPRRLTYYSYGSIVAPKILKIIKQAEKRNFDAAIIGCFYDPAIKEAREISEKIVVTAPMEASLHIASTLGQRFSIIVAWGKLIPLMKENVVKYGFKDNLASFKSIDIRRDAGKAIDLQLDIKETKHRIVEVSKKAIEEDGAEVIILGCTEYFGFYKELQDTLCVPVIDVSLAALHYAEFLIDLRNKHSWYFSKRNIYLSPPIEEIKEWNLLDLY